MSINGERGPHQPGSLRELVAIALPLVLSSGSLTLMHVIDRIFLMWSSTEAMAAAMPSGLLHWTVMSVFIGTATYVNTFVAQYDGAGKKDRVVAAVWQGVYLAVVSGACVTAVFVPLCPLIFAAAGHTPNVQALEIDYFSILCFGAVPMITAAVLSTFFSGRGRTQVLMWVNTGIAAVNIVFDYLMIFGVGPFPEMGIRGAAIATVISQIAGVLMYVAVIVRDRNRDGYAAFRHRRFDRELFGRLLRYGLPTGFQFFSDIAGFLVFIFLIGQIGVAEQAATNLVFNLNALAFIPMMGFGTAVMTLVGKRIGERRPELAVRTTWLAFGLCSVYMLVFCAIYIFLPDVILYPYAVKTTPAEFAPIRELAHTLLMFVALYSFFDGMVIVFGSAVRGAGDTRFSLVFTLIAGWSLMVAPTWIVWHVYEADLLAAWWAVSVYILVAGFGFLIRFQMGQWKSMRVIEADEPECPAEVIVSPIAIDAAPAEIANPPETVTV
jgi:MATE family, multidrug efflux pump